MKLAAVLVVLLGLTGAAAADELVPVDPYAAPPPAMKQQRPQRPLKHFLLAHFDRDRDGRLEPRERMRAAKALHKLANRLARQDGRKDGRRDGRAARKRQFIRRFDLNGDGNVGPREMPPGLADELRPLDRDGDGWLRGNELP
jgi:hypothetical protein